MDEAPDATRLCRVEHRAGAGHVAGGEACDIGRIDDASDMNDGIGLRDQFA